VERWEILIGKNRIKILLFLQSKTSSAVMKVIKFRIMKAL